MIVFTKGNKQEYEEFIGKLDFSEIYNCEIKVNTSFEPYFEAYVSYKNRETEFLNPKKGLTDEFFKRYFSKNKNKN